MRTAVVVGGGIAGIYSAILLKKNYEKVYLIESGDEIGGLLRSFQNKEGDWFDYGTHFIAGTGINEVDKVILNDKWTKDWYCYENEKGGNYFNGVLSESCLFANAKNLGDEYHLGLSQLLEIVNCDGPFKNLEEQLEKTFGYTFAHKVFAPALCKLFCVDSLKDIVVDSHLRFGMKRLIVLNQEATEAIKELPTFDDRIGHHNFKVGNSARNQYYPKQGGAGCWIEKFEELLLSLNIEVICGESVSDIKHGGGVIEQIELSSGKQISCDSLTWTVPLAFMFRAAKIPCETNRPALINTVLFHYVLDQSPNSENHFFFCYDPNFSPFRVTLYSNLQPELAQKTGRHRITVEVLTNESLDLEKMSEKVINDLKIMGVVNQDAGLLYEKSIPVQQGFPVLSHQFVEASESQYELAKNTFKNIHIMGRNSTKSWFMVDVFKSIYENFSSQ